MAEPQYGEPWVVDNEPQGPLWVKQSGLGQYVCRMYPGMTGKDASRLVRCVNLLAAVPNEAPAFSPGPRSDKVMMALAVLEGDDQAALALADEIVGTVVRAPVTPEPHKGLPGLGLFDTWTAFTEHVRGLNSDDRAYYTLLPGVRFGTGLSVSWLYAFIYNQVGGYTRVRREDITIHFSPAAGRTLMQSEELRGPYSGYYEPRMGPSHQNIWESVSIHQVYGTRTILDYGPAVLADLVVILGTVGAALEGGEIGSTVLVVKDVFK